LPAVFARRLREAATFLEDLASDRHADDEGPLTNALLQLKRAMGRRAIRRRRPQVGRRP
jgi:hypothetical protein